ncbi:hypothetical protein SynRS9915_00506 [Synechococcus sp. RS9915]|nr:hypothetical protein SynRS9915_00506 [Synechococcus sp. RS9915]
MLTIKSFTLNLTFFRFCTDMALSYAEVFIFRFLSISSESSFLSSICM